MKTLSARQYAKVLFEITQDLQKKDLEEAVQKFIEMVVQNHAEKKLAEILNEFERYSKKMDGYVEMEVSSAFPLTEALKKNINEIFGGKTEMTVTEDASLLGGVVIKTENKIFDASLKTQLQKMKEQI